MSAAAAPAVAVRNDCAERAVLTVDLIAVTAKRVFTALDCAGLARVDFFLTASGPVLNEVNTVPGITEHSQFPRLFDAVGVSNSELLDQLISSALHNQR